MEGKFDKKGFLWIKRADRFVKMICPAMSALTYCGDWCPKIEEPQNTDDGKSSVICCSNYMAFDKFTDLRT